MNTQNKYDLEERTRKFAERCRDYIKKLPRTITNIEYGSQLARSSGSPGANYIEANERLSKKDFLLRIKICRKESKESKYWLSLTIPLLLQEQEKNILMQEAYELTKIFNSIVLKSS